MKFCEATLSRLSFAVQVTVVHPCANVLPEDGEQLTETPPSTASAAVGAAHETVAPVAAVAVTVWFDGMFESVGAVVSLTVTLKLPLAVLPRLSAAVQVTVVSPMPKTPPETGEQLTATFPSTASAAVGKLKEAFAPFAPVASIVWSDGILESIGAVVSATVTLKLALAEFPALSTAVQVTLVVPMAKVLPEAGEQVTPTLPLTASVAVGLAQVTTLPFTPAASTVLLDGIFEMTGAVVSATVTLKPPLAVLPLWSVAVQVTGVVP